MPIHIYFDLLLDMSHKVVGSAMNTETHISVSFLNLQSNKDILKSLNHFWATL
jgi:hypothetical protein